MTDNNSKSSLILSKSLTRRSALKGLAGGLGAAAAIGTAPGFVRYAQAASSEPIKIGFECHRTGIGAAYGRWYERTTNAAVKLINDAGGINGRPIKLIVEDDGTDAKRGTEVMEKFASEHKVDVVFGTLFSNVVIANAPTAGDLRMPYYVVSEGHHVASGKLKAYGVTAKQKLPKMPTAESLVDVLGPKFDIIYWQGLFAPTGTPKDVVDKLNAAVAKAVAEPELSAIWDKQGFAPFPQDQRSVAAAQAFMKSEMARWGKVIRDNNITISQ